MSSSSPSVIVLPAAPEMPSIASAALDAVAVPSRAPPVRLLLAGTHPHQSNGYSRVVYELMLRLAKRDDIKLTLYAFQRGPVRPQDAERPIPPNVTVFDAASAENPKRAGFNEAFFGEFLRRDPQDVVVVYNDLSVVAMLTDNMREHHPKERDERPFAFVCYLDQVYPTQKKRYLDMLSRDFDGIIAFTEEWKRTIQAQLPPDVDRRMAWSTLPHGLDPQHSFPVTRRLARHYFGLPQDAFVVLNVNRNVPRKRYDHVMMAYARMAAEVEKAGPSARPVRFVIATAMHGCWDLPEIFESECVRLGMAPETCRKYLVGLSNPQAMSDRDVNILHSAADVHFSMADGEGFGLCSLESAAVGVANVATAVGGIHAYLDDQSALLVRPKWEFYVSNIRDNIGGRAEVSDPADGAAALLRYYRDDTLRAEHGRKSRERIIKSGDFDWDVLAARFANYVLDTHRAHQASRKPDSDVSGGEIGKKS